MKIPYQEGTVFAVPLRQGGFAVGVVARTSRGGIMVNYFFGPARNSVPALDELTDIRAQSALRIARVGDLHLLDGKWPIIGQIQQWKREEWPMPLFARRSELLSRAWTVRYPDNDANGTPKEKEITYDQADEYVSDTLHGAGAAEIVLTKLLTP